ncbi:MAG: glycerate kinase [Cellulomonadaceae bacterium]
MNSMTSRGPVVLIAPDSFKGSVTALEACAAIAAGVREACADAVVRELPMADGGEGTLEALTTAWGTGAIEVDTVDARSRPRRARYGASADGSRAVVELAEVSGLPHVADMEPAPLDAHTVGTGDLLRAALDAGADELDLFVGGSASTDGGSGILIALGVRLLDAAGRELPPGGRHLGEVRSIDLSGLHPRARQAHWRVAVDVTNPLVGERGSAEVFGPQKGADADDVVFLDSGLQNLAAVLAAATGTDPDLLLHRPGMGAAGGVSVGLVALFGAELAPGSTLVAEAIGLAEAMADADLVITGEGSCDEQSLGGKVVDAVGAYARRSPAHPPVVVLAGTVRVPRRTLAEHGVTAAFSIAPGPALLDALRADAPRLLTESAANIVALTLTSAH